MKFSQSALDNLQKLKDKGFKIALDDFGSGNSNIDRLIKLQGLIDVIKLDGIVVDINNPITNEYIRATVAIAKVIGIKTLVERVETFEQFIALKTLGIDYFQGYFFHKPSPLPEYRKGDVF
jgi:EAL domain-containing protein (putative c-di-GMP-specific phosphodiesterase class I)